jgi:hypothetical protein
MGMYNKKELELMEKNKQLSKLVDNLISERNSVLNQLEQLQSNYDKLARFKVQDLLDRLKKR